jgi:hypothetical protein
MIDTSEYNSKRTTGDDQQHDGRRNRSVGNGKTDFRFLIPSRDAGGLLTYFLNSNPLFSSIFFQPLLVKVEKLFRIFVLNITVKFKWLIVMYPNAF